MRRLVITGLILGLGGLLVGGCPATFEPLEDDDIFDDDDSSATDDDDTAADDDDTSVEQPIFESTPTVLAEGGIYTVIFMGTDAGAEPISMLVLQDNAVTPSEGFPHLRFVHGASEVPAADIRITDTQDTTVYEVTSLPYGSASPTPLTVGYADLTEAGNYTANAYDAGGTDALTDPLSLGLTADTWTTVLLTATGPAKLLVGIGDAMNAPATDNVSVRVVHSIGDVPTIRVEIERLSSGMTQNLTTNGLSAAEAGDAWQLPADTVTFRVYES